MLSQGNLHILDQADGTPWWIPIDKLLTGTLIIGPQQGGKSRLLVYLCQQINSDHKYITLTILDPKDGFKRFLPCFGALYLDWEKYSFDLKPPPGVDYENFIFEFMPILADLLGLIYGLEILNEGAEIALTQRKAFIAATGKNTELCLRDIYVAISLIKVGSNGRRAGYRDACQTALSRVLGRKPLFACRKGIPIIDLFKQSTINNCRCLTDDMQCRVINAFFLYWDYQASRQQPETNQIVHLVCYR